MKKQDVQKTLEAAHARSNQIIDSFVKREWLDNTDELDDTDELVAEHHANTYAPSDDDHSVLAEAWRVTQRAAQAQERIDQERQAARDLDALHAEARRRMAQEQENSEPQGRQIADRDKIASFLFAGRATVTLRSQATGARFTFKVAHKEGGDVSFVSLLTGPSNEADYRYLGLLPDNDHDRLRGVGRGKSCASHDAPSARAFQYLLDYIAGRVTGKGLEVWHEGRCGRCNRKLTVPESIESGIGPECASRMG